MHIFSPLSFFIVFCAIMTLMRSIISCCIMCHKRQQNMRISLSHTSSSSKFKYHWDKKNKAICRSIGTHFLQLIEACAQLQWWWLSSHVFQFYVCCQEIVNISCPMYDGSHQRNLLCAVDIDGDQGAPVETAFATIATHFLLKTSNSY